jgi:hypothetical protein
MREAIQRKLEQIDLLAERLEFYERTGVVRPHVNEMCAKLFAQLDYDPLPVEMWGVMARLWMGAPLDGIPEPTEPVTYDEVIEKYGEFVQAHAEALETKMSFEQSVDWSEQSLAWARFWTARHPSPSGRSEYAVIARSIEDDLAMCIGRVREIWRRQGLHPQMVGGTLVLMPVKGERG